VVNVFLSGVKSCPTRSSNERQTASINGREENTESQRCEEKNVTPLAGGSPPITIVEALISSPTSTPRVAMKASPGESCRVRNETDAAGEARSTSTLLLAGSEASKRRP